MTCRYKGIVAAPHTPFHTDGVLNLDAIEPQAEWLRGQSVVGAFICGSTGEGASLTIAERKQVASRWKSVVGNSVPVIVHVGHTCVADAKDLAIHAAGIGADGIAAIPPWYYPGRTITEIVSSLAEIAAGAPELPFYYYHIPSCTHVTVSMPALFEEALRCIPSFGGLKYSHYDLFEFQQLLGIAGDQYDLFWGMDEALLGALAVGAKAAVGSTYNHAGPLYNQMIQSFEAGDMEGARRCSQTAVKLVKLVAERGLVPSQKAILSRAGVPLGPPRLPMTVLTDAETDQLLVNLTEIGQNPVGN